MGGPAQPIPKGGVPNSVAEAQYNSVDATQARADSAAQAERAKQGKARNLIMNPNGGFGSMAGSGGYGSGGASRRTLLGG